MRNKMYPVRLVSDFCRCVTQYQQWISGSAYWQMSHPCHRKKINSLHTLHCGLECWEWHKMLPACAGSVRVLRGMRWNIRLGLIWQRTREWLCTTLRIIPYPNPSFFFPQVEYFGNRLLKADVCKCSFKIPQHLSTQKNLRAKASKNSYSNFVEAFSLNPR